MSSGMSSSEHGVSDEALSVLHDLPALRSLPDDVRAIVLDAFEPIAYDFGGVIVAEGDAADAFYVIASGSARVVTHADGGEEVSLDVLRRGDYFGEIGVLEDSTRVATVRAREPVEALKLERGVFRALVNRYPDVRASFARLALVRTAATFLRLHSVFAALPPEGLREMAEAFEPVEADAGETVVRVGAETGPMYLVESGRLRVARDGAELEYAHAGDFFGELSVLHGGAREATVEALTPCRLLALAPDAVRRLLDAYPEFRRRVEERTALADFRYKATVPLDFAEELLPAEVAGADRVDAGDATAAPRDASVAEELEPREALPPRPRRRRKLPHVYQLDAMDCGAACLAMVTRYFGKTVGLPRIRDLVHTSTDGTSLLGIAQGAVALGFEARNVRASKSRLDRLPLPAVCHWEANHWVVLYEIGPETVKIGDPARGIRTLSRQEFDEKWTGYATLLSPTPMFETLEEDRADYRWLVGFLHPHRRAIAGATLLALLAAGLELAVPVFTQIIVDDAIPEGDTTLLLIGLGVMLAVLVAMVVATVVQRYILSSAAVRIDTAALDFLTGRLLGLPMSYFARRRTGDIERRLSGVRQVRGILVDSGVEGLTMVAQVVAAVCLMLVYSWQLTLVYLAVVPLYVLLMRYSAHRLRPMFDNLEEAYGRYASQQIDAIRGIETVKVLAAEDGFRGQMRDRFSGLADRVFRAEFLIMTYQGAVQLVTILSLILFLFAGGLLVIDGQLTLGEFVAFNALVLLTNGPVLVLLSLWDELQMGRILLDRLGDVVAAEPEQGADREGLRGSKGSRGRSACATSAFATAGRSRPRFCPGSTSTSLPAPPSPSWGGRARARRRS